MASTLPHVQIELRYFADAREAAGCDGETLSVGESACVRDLLDAACTAHPLLLGVGEECRVAVNEAFASEDTRLEDGATVALIPPVGGG